MIDPVTVQSIAADDTHDLRRSVLRGGDPEAAVEWEGDHDPGTAHLGAFDANGQLVGVSTWLRSPDPSAPSLRSIQLRGMATEAASGGRGIGRVILAAGISHAREVAVDQVWANARVGALGFYELTGFTVTGPVFVTAMTGLPHRHVHIDIR